MTMVIRAIIQTLACAAIGAATNAAVRRFHKGPAKRLFTFESDKQRVHAAQLDELVELMINARLSAHPFKIIVQDDDQRILIMEYPHGGGQEQVH